MNYPIPSLGGRHPTKPQVSVVSEVGSALPDAPGSELLAWMHQIEVPRSIIIWIVAWLVLESALQFLSFSYPRFHLLGAGQTANEFLAIVHLA